MLPGGSPLGTGFERQERLNEILVCPRRRAALNILNSVAITTCGDPVSAVGQAVD